jgi:hypothetical protein
MPTPALTAGYQRRSRTAIFAILLGMLCLVLASSASAEPPIKAMVQVRLAGETVEGQPLAWSNSLVHLLGRDGQLISFSPGSSPDLRQSSPRFYSYTPSEMRARLYTEFDDKKFAIAITQHYVVVYPKASKAPWATRFEELYKQFYHYFQVRGASLHDANCPLVAIVFPNKAAYQQYSRSHGMKISDNYWGHYARNTNRVYLFDVQADYPQLKWDDAAALIVHEATHQTAFNTGIHSRFGDSPRWITEGLAMMFEARGVWNSGRYQQQSDRINRERLTEFRETLAKRPPHWFAQIIINDASFATREKEAYAESWAFTFYLCETNPRLYAKYLARTAAIEDFADYSPTERLRDFTDIFGDNLKLIDAQFLRYIEKLK